MMKKGWIMGALVLGMALTATACGKKENSTEESTQTVEENRNSETTDENRTQLIQLGEYKGIQVPVMEIEPTEEELGQEIENMLESHGYLVEVEGKTVIEEGDVVNIDYRGLIDGEEFEGGTSREGGFDLTIGSGEFIAGFEEQLIGKELGGFYQLDLAFTENYRNKEVAGKPVIFEVTVNKIQERIIPELTDTFVQENLGLSSVDAYRESVEESLRLQKQENAQAKKEYDVLTGIVELSEFTVSEEEVQTEKEQIVAANEYSAAAYGMDMETYLYYFMNGISMEEFEKQCESTAEMRIKSALVIEAVAEAEQITVSDEGYVEKAEMMMGDYGFTSLEEFEKTYTREAIMENIVYNETVDFLVEQAVEV